MRKKNSKKSPLSEYQPYKVSKSLIKELEIFMEFVPPRRLSRNLRNLFLEFLPHYIRHAVPSDLDDTTTDLYFLLEFLDKAGEELLQHDKRSYEL